MKIKRLNCLHDWCKAEWFGAYKVLMAEWRQH